MPTMEQYGKALEREGWPKIRDKRGLSDYSETNIPHLSNGKRHAALTISRVSNFRMQNQNGYVFVLHADNKMLDKIVYYKLCILSPFLGKIRTGLTSAAKKAKGPMF